MTPVFINGIGLATAQGADVETNWQNLLAGRVLHEKGIVPIERDRTLPRVSQLAIHVAHQARVAAGSPALSDDRTALIIGTSKGPIEDWIDQLDGHRPPDICLGLAQVAHDVAAAVGHAHGPRLTLAGACASGLLALIRAVDLIRQGTCDRALVVAAEASTHALFEANFRRLGVLANPEDGCRPFDVHRHGFLLGEAAAAVVISRHARQPTDPMIVGTASYADATHLTGPDPTAAALTHALSRFADQPIDLIHAHGTGTVLNDPAELLAIERKLAARRPTIYSHKHATGHTQGAAGLIAVVINTVAHQRGVIPGNSNTHQPVPWTAGQISREPTARTVETSAIIAAGFGGTIAGLSMKSAS